MPENLSDSSIRMTFEKDLMISTAFSDIEERFSRANTGKL